MVFFCKSDKFGPLGASAVSSRAPCPPSSLGAYTTTVLRIRRALPEPQLRSRVSASKTHRFPCAEVANSSLPGPRVGPFRACARVRASTRACGKSECGLGIVFCEHEEHEVAYSLLQAFKMWSGNGVLETRRARSGLQLVPGIQNVVWEWCFSNKCGLGIVCLGRCVMIPEKSPTRF